MKAETKITLTIPDEDKLGETDFEITVSYSGYCDGIGGYEFWGSRGYDKGQWVVDDYSVDAIDGRPAKDFDKCFVRLVDEMVDDLLRKNPENFPEPEYEDYEPSDWYE